FFCLHRALRLLPHISSHPSSLHYLYFSLRFFFLILPPPPTSTLFPYTTLFRSRPSDAPHRKRPAPGRAGPLGADGAARDSRPAGDRKSTRLNSSHQIISYAVFCLKKKKNNQHHNDTIINMYDVI